MSETVQVSKTGGAGGPSGANPGGPGAEGCPTTKNPGGAGGAVLPKGYYVNAAGLQYVDNSNPDKDPVTYRLGPFIEVVGRTRDIESNEWGLLLRWRDPDGVVHELAMANSLLSDQRGGWVRELAAGGWMPEPGQKQRQLLAAFFAKVAPASRVRCVPNVGHHDGCFVLPDEVIGRGLEPVALQACMAGNPYKQAGTLEQWQNTVGQWAQGNSRLVFALALSFSGPLLSMVGMSPGGANFHGTSSTGKTTCLLAAQSVWGSPRDINTWNATRNGVEGALELHNDSFYSLDELNEATGKTVYDVVYMLGNGRGRARANQDGSAKQVRRFCCSIMSTGEQTVEAKLAADGLQGKAGHGVRLMEIPADAGAGMGAWEKLHGHESPRAFSEAVDRASHESHGTPGRAFVRELIANRDELALSQDLQVYCAAWTPPGASGQVARVVRRFALFALAGELARAFKIVPWREGEAFRAVKQCLDDWLQARGGVGNHETTQATEMLRAFVARFGQSRFQSLDGQGGERIPDRAGFRRVVGDRTQYVFLPQQLGAVLAGLHLPAAVKALDSAGYIRRNEKHATQKISLPEYGRARCYVVELPEVEGGEAC